MSNIILILTQVLQLLVVLALISSSPVIASSPSSSPSSPTHLLILDKTDLEYSDTSNGDVTNSDQQVVYINHGGGAVSTIRRSFAIPFSPHVSSYPSTLFDNSQQQPPQSSSINKPTHNIQSPVTSSLHHPNDFHREISAGFSRRAGPPEERSFDDSSFDEPRGDVDNSFQVDPGVDSGVDQDDNIKNHRMDDYRDASPPTARRRESFHGDDVSDPKSQKPPPPPPLGLPVPPTSYGVRTNNRLSGDLFRLTDVERRQNTHENPSDPESKRRSFTTSENHPRSNSNANNFDDQPQNHKQNQRYNNNNVHNNNVNPFLNSLGPLTNTFTQGLSPDLFGLFDSPFVPLAGLPPSSNSAGNQDNLFQRRRLAINNVVPDIVHNGIAGPSGGNNNYPSSYNNYFTGDQRGSAATEEDGMKWPKIFKFTDGRINLNDFEKDKKLGRIKFMKKDPAFDNVRRDSFLILHGGTYS